MYIDGLYNGSTSIITGIDLDGQEQRIVIGGGNDRKFRECQLDNFRVWKKQIIPSANEENCTRHNADDLITNFEFNDGTDGVVLKDCSNLQGNAIRVGSLLQKASSFVRKNEDKCYNCSITHFSNFARNIYDRTSRSIQN